MKNQPLNFDHLLDSVQLEYKNEEMMLRAALNLAVENAVKAANFGRKAATVNVTLKLTPDRHSNMILETSVTNKDPKVSAGKKLLYSDNRGRLFEHDPHQPTLDAVPENVVQMKGANQ